MDSRRVPRTVSDPKVLQVGFFAPPDRSHSGPPDPISSSHPVSNISPSGNSLSPVMIPPPRHLSTDIPRNFHHPPPLSPLRAPSANDSSIPVGSYNPSEFSSPSADFSEDQSSPRWGRKCSSGKFAMPLPSGGFGMAVAAHNIVANPPSAVPDGGANTEKQKEKKADGGKPSKEKTTKAERRALQEAQRAAKAAAKGKSLKPRKMKKQKQLVANDLSSDRFLEKTGEQKVGDEAEDKVYQMSSGDEDCSKGMKKWITEHYQSRPGVKVLQERIDDFIIAHEAIEERARAEKEAQAAAGGWTVVVQQKGRKKTTDAESGIAVGSVAQAAVVDKMEKNKKKDVGLDFYRFQKREAHRNEVMMLQSKFEQVKKWIQQMRAARKFRPY